MTTQTATAAQAQDILARIQFPSNHTRRNLEKWATSLGIQDFPRSNGLLAQAIQESAQSID